jgi:hypothetical protein
MHRLPAKRPPACKSRPGCCPYNLVNPTRASRPEMGGEAIGLTTNLTGDVQSVSADALIDETTKEPYYLAQVVIDRSSLRPELLQRLVPGMPADVLISRGERTMLEHLIDPLRNALANSMREN